MRSGRGSLCPSRVSGLRGGPVPVVSPTTVQGGLGPTLLSIFGFSLGLVSPKNAPPSWATLLGAGCARGWLPVCFKSFSASPGALSPVGLGNRPQPTCLHRLWE